MRFCEVCQKNPVFGTDKLTRIGYCKNHQHLRTDISKESIAQRAIKKQRANAVCIIGGKIRNLAYELADIKAPKDYAELDRWFKQMQKRMTGKCMNCGGKTEAFTKNYKCSIAHILPKAYFKSVATNDENWLELCFYGNSCHTNYDNKMLDLIEMNCFDTIIQKFTKMYPHIAPEEKRRIPPILIEYLKTEI
jgi:hypothetical protein